MNNIFHNITAFDLFKKLENKGLVDSADKLCDTALTVNQQENADPINYKILTSIGAIISALFLILLLLVTFKFSFFTSAPALITTGALMIAAAIMMHMDNEDTNNSSYLSQLSLTFVLTGKLLFIFGIYTLFKNTWATPIALTALTAVTYYHYKFPFEHFLSILATSISITANIFTLKSSLAVDLTLGLFYALHFLVIGHIYYQQKTSQYKTILYATAFSTTAITLGVSSIYFFFSLKTIHVPNAVFMNMVLLTTFIAFMCWKYKSFKSLRVKFSLAGAVILAIISTPGILLSAMFLILGYLKHNKHFITLGALFMPVFIYLYYYSLNITLLEKSAVLIGSGLSLILACYFMHKKGWNQKVENN